MGEEKPGSVTVRSVFGRAVDGGGRVMQGLTGGHHL